MNLSRRVAPRGFAAKSAETAGRPPRRGPTDRRRSSSGGGSSTLPRPDKSVRQKAASSGPSAPAPHATASRSSIPSEINSGCKTDHRCHRAAPMTRDARLTTPPAGSLYSTTASGVRSGRPPSHRPFRAARRPGPAENRARRASRAPPAYGPSAARPRRRPARFPAAKPQPGQFLEAAGRRPARPGPASIDRISMAMRSGLTASIWAAMPRIAAKVHSSKWKLKAAENRTARSIRSLSSAKRSCGTPMARTRWPARSSCPPTKSITCSAIGSKNRPLMVKSRRVASSRADLK